MGGVKRDRDCVCVYVCFLNSTFVILMGSPTMHTSFLTLVIYSGSSISAKSNGLQIGVNGHIVGHINSIR